MYDLIAVMNGVRGNLGSINGLRTPEFTPDTISPPTAIVPVPRIDYKNGLGRSRMSIQGTILLFTSKGWNRTGQEQLANFASLTGDRSIVQAIDRDRTLGGACGDCTVSDFRPLSDEEFGEIGYWGGVFTLDIL